MWSWGGIREMARQADLQELAQTVFVAIVFAFMLSKLLSMFMAIRSSMRAGNMRVERLSPSEEAQEGKDERGASSSSDEKEESIHSVDSEGDRADISGLSEGRADFSEVSEGGGLDEASGAGVGSPAPIIKKDEVVEQEAITGHQSLATMEAGYEPSTSSSVEAEAGSNRSISAMAMDEDDDGSSDWEGVESTELDEAFGAASSFIATQAGGLKVSSETQLQLYGLYKVATEGPCHTVQPSALKMTARAKWNAWQKLGNISQEEAMERYVELVSELSPDWASNQKSKGKEGTSGSKQKKGPVGPVFSTLAYDERSDDGSLDALHIAAREGNEPGLLELLSQGVPVDVQDSDGRTALHWASDRGHLGLVELLLSRGAKLQAKDKEGQTALHYACVCEQEMVAKFLISKGADLQARDAEGSTPLNYRPANWDWMNE
ncbi:acyl-CoA-binding domain-containing protein 1 [Selaginella moellendorffii]|uniref:acyl-CoA-binding domain-containing protein 1 n=1 Tax=Selaginella moellendorffii TaxID=88036 RepID=UPI000D1C399B|nr:acyl-CoA-binding domain-containing protein 1 [Selaginella moellendorffii]|eukprot:XP_024542159.1 acyl-CoA-binding domain-containing protein 1 [Selaginella moellendorffii]